MTPSPYDIEAYLASLEYEQNIAVLGAWAAGSRAWGTDNRASDYDIRVVYVHPHSELTDDTQSIKLTGDELDTVSPKSAIEPGDVEFEGWDATYFVDLLCDSNPSALEALHSPVPYRQHPVFTEMGEYMADHFHVIELGKQYRGMAENNYRRYITGERRTEAATAKRTLTVIRTLMYADYVYETHELPPFVFPTFLERAPDEVLEPWDIADVRSLVDYAQMGDGGKHIGNRFETTIEERLATLNIANLRPQDHVRENDNRVSGDALREYMTMIIQSRLLTQ